ncbi:class I SAM-dependent methyltransferase [Planctomycetota bacterium]
MVDSVISKQPITGLSSAPRRKDLWARKTILKQLAPLQWGKINITENHQTITYGAAESPDSETVNVQVLSSRFYSYLMFYGNIGAAEAYILGFWDCSDLTLLIRILIRNQRLLEYVEGSWAYLTIPLQRVFHWLHRNTKSGSQANIAAHYDLGNDFYSLFLDETMTYSCNIFESTSVSLEQAAATKYDRLCRKLRLSPDDHVLEIGAGWGGFAIYAAENFGCKITTTTISSQQYEWAKNLVAKRCLMDRIDLHLKDYRDLSGKYDKLVSIEMIEAVGHEFIKTYFQRCSRLLKPDGMMALQAITIKDQFYKQHVRTVDFIKRYIFPGSCLTSVTSMCQAATEATDLRLFHMEDITPHYAMTLRCWRDRFLSNLDKIRKLGFPETFIRMWEYYFGYCEGAFTERYIGDVQLIFAKPLCREEPILPVLSSSEMDS